MSTSASGSKSWLIEHGRTVRKLSDVDENLGDVNSWDEVLAYLNAAYRRVASYWTGLFTAVGVLAGPFFIVFNQPWSLDNHVGGWLLFTFAAAALWIFVRVSRWAWRVGPGHPYVRFCFVVCLTLILTQRDHHSKR